MSSGALRHPATAIPNFALYGHEALPNWLDMVHVERIPVRSSLFDFEAIGGARTESHTAEPSVGQPFSDLVYAANDF